MLSRPGFFLCAASTAVVLFAAGGAAAQRTMIPYDSIPQPAPPLQQPTPPRMAPAPSDPAQGGAYTMGEIGRRASYGEDGGWTTSASPDGALVFTGRGNSAGWTADVVRPPALPYTVQVELTSTIAAVSGRAVGAGLVFGFNRPSAGQQRTFYTALVTGDTLTVYRYDGSFNQIIRSSSGRGGSRVNRAVLRLEVRQNSFSVSLNDNGSVSQDAEGSLTGDYGVLASGEGEAVFRNLRVQGGSGR